MIFFLKATSLQFFAYLMLCLLITAITEVLQFLTPLCNFNDLIANLIGVMLGLFSVKFIMKSACPAARREV
jgi:VanZ family protein